MERLQRGLRAPDTGHDACGTGAQPAPLPSRKRAKYGAGQACLDIIWPAPLMAERAVIPMPLVKMCVDPEVVHTDGILIKIVSGHNCGLCAKQLLA